MKTNTYIKHVTTLLLLLMMAGAASALQVETLGSENIIDASIRSDYNDDTGATLRVGDQAVGDKIWWGVVQINSSNLTATSSSIVSVILKYKITTMTPNTTVLSGLAANYSNNDTWAVANNFEPAGNYADGMTKGFFVNNTWISFDITKNFTADYANSSDRLSTIVIRALGTSANGVANDVYLASADYSVAADRPKVEVYYDTNNATEYANISFYNYTLTTDGVSQDMYDNYVLAYIKTDNGNYAYQSNVLPASITYFVGQINSSDAPSGNVINEITNDTNSGTPVFDYDFMNIISHRTASVTYSYGSRVTNKSIYINLAKNKINLSMGTLGIPFWYGGNNNSNARVEDNSGVVANISGIEDLGTFTGGTMNIRGNLTNVTGGFYVNEFTHTDNFVGGTQDKEFWMGFDSDQAYGFLIYVDSRKGIPNDFSSGMLFWKATGEKYYFDKVAGLMTTYNDTATTDRIPINWTMYSNATGNGTLVLNSTGFAKAFNKHIFANMSGTWIRSNGTQEGITNGTSLLEYDFSPRIYVKSLSGGYLFHEQYTTSTGLNVSVAPASTSNITLSFNGTERPFLNVLNEFNTPNSTINFSRSINNETRFTQANFTFNSSQPFNISINVYNSSVINFTATNSTPDQPMNLTVYNDTYPIVNGVNYQILKDGLNQQISTASDNSVAFSSISVGSDYTIQKVIPPASITSITASVTSSSINWTWTNPSDIDFNHTEIYLDGVFTTNTSLNYYIYTLRSASTSYTLSTRTSDTNYNVNSTWMNMTNTTSISPSSLPSSSGGSGSYLETIEVPPKNTPTFNITYNNNTIPLLGNIKMPKKISDYDSNIDKRLLAGVAFIVIIISLFLYSNLSNKKLNKHKRKYT